MRIVQVEETTEPFHAFQFGQFRQVPRLPTMSVPELLDLMRRLPPQKTADNMAKLVDCLGGPSNDVADEILSSVDQPLRVMQDSTGRDFLACDFNRDSLGDDAAADDAGTSSGDAHRCVRWRPQRMRERLRCDL